MKAHISKYVHVWLFVLISFLSLNFVLVLLPPFQAADEIAHFYRAEQISNLQFRLIKKDEKQSGGFVDIATIEAQKIVSDIPFHSDKKYTEDKDDALKNLKFSNHLTFVNSPNTASYAPYFYIPSALGISIAKLTDCSLQNTILFARLINGIVCIFISVLALYIANKRWITLYVVLTLPMSLYSFGIVSPDGLIYATTALLTSMLAKLCTKIDDSSNTVYYLMLFGVFLTIGLILSTKISYLPFLALVYLLILHRRVKSSLFVIGLFFVLLLISLWIVFGLIPTTVPLSPGYHVSIKEQFFYVLSHPLHNFILIYNTLVKYFGFYIKSCIGIFGWLDTPLKNGLYYYYVVYLLGGLTLGVCLQSNVGAYNFKGNLTVKLTMFLTFFCILYTLYLAWSPIGSTKILGVQGRYFIPVLLLFVLITPKVGKWQNIPKYLPQAILIMSTLTTLVIPYTLYFRYHV